MHVPRQSENSNLSGTVLFGYRLSCLLSLAHCKWHVSDISIVVKYEEELWNEDTNEAKECGNFMSRIPFSNGCRHLSGLPLPVPTLGAKLLDAESEGVTVGGGSDEMNSFLTRALFNSSLSLS